MAMISRLYFFFFSPARPIRPHMKPPRSGAAELRDRKQSDGFFGVFATDVGCRTAWVMRWTTTDCASIELDFNPCTDFHSTQCRHSTWLHHGQTSGDNRQLASEAERDDAKKAFFLSPFNLTSSCMQVPKSSGQATVGQVGHEDELVVSNSFFTRLLCCLGSVGAVDGAQSEERNERNEMSASRC